MFYIYRMLSGLVLKLTSANWVVNTVLSFIPIYQHFVDFLASTKFEDLQSKFGRLSEGADTVSIIYLHFVSILRRKSKMNNKFSQKKSVKLK